MGNDPDADLKRAQQLFDLGRAAEARTIAASVLAVRPDGPGALRLLARCHMALGEGREAVRIAKAAVAADPAAEHGHRILATALRRIKRHQEAADAAAEAVRLAPQEWRAHVVLAQSLYRVDLKRALAAAEEARRLAPQSAETHYLCGVTLRALHRPNEARVALLRALEIDPQHAPSLNGLAALDQRRLRLTSAARGFRRALRVDPQQRVAQRNLEAVLLLRLWVLGCLAATSVQVVVASSADGAGAGRIRGYAVGCEAVLLVLVATSEWAARKKPGASGARLLHRDRSAMLCKAVVAASIVLIAIAAVIPKVTGTGVYSVAWDVLMALTIPVLFRLRSIRRKGAASPDTL
jgi:tetratricopeptide (TPR) repeat protein